MDKTERQQLARLANDAIVDCFGSESREQRLAEALETCVGELNYIADKCEHCSSCEHHGDHADKPTVFTKI